MKEGKEFTVYAAIRAFDELEVQIKNTAQHLKIGKAVVEPSLAFMRRGMKLLFRTNLPDLQGELSKEAKDKLWHFVDEVVKGRRDFLIIRRADDGDSLTEEITKQKFEFV